MQDKEGYIWFGTNGDGAYRYDGTNFQNITTQDGLAHNTVRQIIQDSAGNFWFATPNRVTRHTPPQKKVKPRVHIIQAMADEVYENPDNIESTTNRVTFVYKGLSFKTKSDRIKYIYKLEGQDGEWNQATGENRVRYENLEAGEYLFQVKAIDRDLNYSHAAQVKLTVIPDPRNGHIARLEEQIHQQERVEMKRIYQELQDARQIQQSLLPEGSPHIAGFEIVGVSLPAREVGGDFYDYLLLADDVGIVLADVSGKSARAAMVAAMANGMLHTEVKGQSEIWGLPSMILGELNVTLQPRLIRGMFIAVSLGILQPKKKRLLFSNAGIPYPVVKRGDEVWELEVNGLPLGIVDYAEYSDLSVDLEPGDFVIFCSDGVSEATNEAGEFYGTDGLLETVQQANSSLSAQEMMDWIVKDVTEFVGDVEPSDDITIIVLRCN